VGLRREVRLVRRIGDRIEEFEGPLASSSINLNSPSMTAAGAGLGRIGRVEEEDRTKDPSFVGQEAGETLAIEVGRTVTPTRSRSVG